MRTETVHDIMMRVRRQSSDFANDFLKEVLGIIILTDYNNKTYRIDDIDFTRKVSDSFDTKNGSITFIDYYQSVSNHNACSVNYYY